MAAGLDLIDAELREISVSGGPGPRARPAADRHRRGPGDHPARQRSVIRPFRPRRLPCGRQSDRRAIHLPGRRRLAPVARAGSPIQDALTEADMRKTLPLLCCRLGSWPGPVRHSASHYAVADVPRLITPAAGREAPQGEGRDHRGAAEQGGQEQGPQGARQGDRTAGARAPRLVHRCDLLRIKGVGSEMVLLFEAAGVKSTADLVTQGARPP